MHYTETLTAADWQPGQRADRRPIQGRVRSNQGTLAFDVSAGRQDPPAAVDDLHHTAVVLGSWQDRREGASAERHDVLCTGACRRVDPPEQIAVQQDNERDTDQRKDQGDRDRGCERDTSADAEPGPRHRFRPPRRYPTPRTVSMLTSWDDMSLRRRWPM